MSRNPFLCILQFELNVQMRTRSFWLISLLPPLAMILMYAANFSGGEADSVAVVNRTTLADPIAETRTMSVRYVADSALVANGYDAIITLEETGDDGVKCIINAKDFILPPNLTAIEDGVKTRMAESRLGVNFADAKAVEGGRLRVEMHSENEGAGLIGLTMPAIFVVYLVILQFASSIIRLMGREKKNKISEILLSAMSSRAIMGGKLAACLVAALLQVCLWCAVGYAIVRVAQTIPTFAEKVGTLSAIVQGLTLMPADLLLEFAVLFLLLLVGGFWLYTQMFAILGAVSNENTNTQQFSLIVTMPLLITFIYVVKDFGAETPLLSALVYIPFSSPIAAIPFVAKHGLTPQIGISLLILYATAAVAFRYSCVLYEQGTLATKAKVTGKTLLQWMTGPRAGKKSRQ